MRYYIATRIDRIPEHNILRDLLSDFGHDITYDWTHNFASSNLASDILTDIAVKESEGVIDADWVFVLLPGGRGTHVELGAAIACRKKIIIIASNIDGLSGGYAEVCPFYLHPCCTIVETVADAVNMVNTDMNNQWKEAKR